MPRYMYQRQPIKIDEGTKHERVTSYSISRDGTMYDDINGTIIKVGVMDRKTGDLVLLNKYKECYSGRLQQLKSSLEEVEEAQSEE